jgi:hypothetical protein
MHYEPEFAYHYRADDGREALSAGSDVRRVPRGGALYGELVTAHSAFRYGLFPDERDFIETGFRLAVSDTSAIS